MLFSRPTLDAILVVNKWLSDGAAQEVLLASVACTIMVPMVVAGESRGGFGGGAHGGACGGGAGGG